MDLQELKYYTKRNGFEINLSPEESDRVHNKLERMYETNEIRSGPTGNGRYYTVPGGEIEYAIGVQPTLTIRSPRRSTSEEIANRFGLPVGD